jgi:hypothetical protein
MLGIKTAEAANLFQIDLLLFRHKNASGVSNEHWPRVSVGPDRENAIALQQARPAGSPYAQVPGNARKLNAERLQLDRSGRYETLLHLAWLQPAANGDKGEKLYFQLPDSSGGAARLSGVIRIDRSRFLHADLDAVYQQNFASSSESGGGESWRFRLQEKRRMRSNELHYLDNPAFGALMIATAISSADEAAAENSLEQSTPQTPSAPEPN